MATPFVWEDAQMDKAAIMEFAGLYLDKRKHLTVPELQRFIMERSEVGKAIPIEEIEESLNMLYVGKFIRITCSSRDGGTVYEKELS